MRYRLLVNLNAKRKAGSIVTAEDIGEKRIEQLRGQGFLKVYVDEQAAPGFEAALEAYRLHMEAAPPLIVAVLDETKTDDQVITFADALFEISSTVPKEIQRVMAEVFERARELALADPENIPSSAFASLSMAAAEDAAGMDAASDHNAPPADQADDATRGVAQSEERLAHNQDVGGSSPPPAPNPEGGAVAAATVVTTSEEAVSSSPDGAAAATAASNDTPSAEAGAAKKSPAAKRGGPKKSGAA